MTVYQLIQLLSEYDPNQLVGMYTEFGIRSVRSVDTDDDGDPVIDMDEEE